MLKLKQYSTVGPGCNRTIRSQNNIFEIDIWFDDALPDFGDERVSWELSIERKSSSDPAAIIQILIWPTDGKLSHIHLMYSRIAISSTAFLEEKPISYARSLYFDVAPWWDPKNLMSGYLIPTIQIQKKIELINSNNSVIALCRELGEPDSALELSNGDKILLQQGLFVGLEFIHMHI